ncbi:hypothetical protein [Mycolicibacterium sphagni]|uniref:hypothetical protein n=1 Tax=Mycolicibacterium sphagni TaxID=1786 RepID=UPI001576443F|nr:hypothetical protein [Mycolicibacterium sphagni]
MEPGNNLPPVPADATKATEDQLLEQQQLDHQNDDPDAPGHNLDRHQVADET